MSSSQTPNHHFATSPPFLVRTRKKLRLAAIGLVTESGTSVWQQAIRALGLLWVARVGSLACLVLFQLALARGLGEDGYGRVAGAIAALNLVAALGQFGVGQYWQRAFGIEGQDAWRWMQPSLHLSAYAFSGAFVFVMVGVTILGAFETSVAGLVLWLFPLGTAVGATSLLSARLQFDERYTGMAAIEFFRQALLLSAALAAWWWSLDEASTVTVLALAGICITLFSVLRIGTDVGLRAEAGGRYARRAIGPIDVARQSWPYAGVAVTYSLFFQSDLILLNFLSSSTEAAAYAAAVAFLTAAYQVPFVFYSQFLLPKLHRWMAHDVRRLDSVFMRSFWITTAFGVVIAGVLWITGSRLVAMMFGPTYASSGGLLNWLAIVVPVRFASSAVGATLISVEMTKLRTLYFAGCAVLNVGLNLLLIPRFGAQGAVASTVLAELVLLLLFVRRRSLERGLNVGKDPVVA